MSGSYHPQGDKIKYSPDLIVEFLSKFQLEITEQKPLSESKNRNTLVDSVRIADREIPRFTNEFWTSRQRKGNSLQEISYRACFKPQLPRFFINLLSSEKDFIYDPFSGRGTTAIEAALLNRKIIANDINPLSAILCKPRLEIPTLDEIKERLDRIKFKTGVKSGNYSLYVLSSGNGIGNCKSQNIFKQTTQKRKRRLYRQMDQEWLRQTG